MQKQSRAKLAKCVEAGKNKDAMSFCARLKCLSLRALLTAGSVWLFAGCAADAHRRVPDPTPVAYDRPSLVKVMEELDERRYAVETLVVRTNVVLHDHVKNKKVGLNGAYLGDKDGNLRLQIRYNETVIMDLGIHGDTVDLWLPRKNRYFRGTRKDLLAANECELSLLAHAGNMPDLFFPRAWTAENASVETQRRGGFEGGREVVKVYERPGIKWRCVRMLHISMEQPVAEQVDVYSRNEKSVGCIQYDDYRFPGPSAGEIKRTPTYPGRVTLVNADKSRSLEMNVEELIPNTPIDTEKFEVKVPEGQKILDLGQHLGSGKSLWE